MYSRLSKLSFAVFLLLCTLAASRAAFSEPVTPVAVTIESASINYSLNELTVHGTGFEPSNVAPTVTFNGTRLTLVSSSTTVIVAKLSTT